MALMGKTLKYDYLYPDLKTPSDFDVGQGDIVVKDGVEVTNSFYTMDIADTYIRFEFKDTGLFKLADFSGPVLEDINGEVNPFSKFDLQTNMHGLERSDIRLTEDGIHINWQGASLTTKTYVHINLYLADNEVFGSSLADDLMGTDSADMIKGRAGNDILRSDAALETSTAKTAVQPGPLGSNADKLYGGAGIDTFVFATGDTARKHVDADTIFDLDARAGETIDLTGWDANRRQDGDQLFDFIGRHTFSGHAGELRYVTGRSDTWIEGDTNGDAKADFTIHLDDAMKLRTGNFEL